MAEEAFGMRETRHRPDAEEKGFVANWLAQREAFGPPDDAGVADKGNDTVRVGGREFYVRRFDLPGQDPAGYMVVMNIV